MVTNRYDDVKTLILREKKALSFNEEDEKLLLKLWDAYWKKKKGDLRGNAVVLAGAVLWRYSSDNHLWEHDQKWTQKSLAELFQVRGKTIGNNASEIGKVLKINYFDDRFCRKTIADSNPLKSMAVLPNGFILSKEMAVEKGLLFAPLKKSKEDYYYEGCDRLEVGQDKKATYCFKKALEMDDGYVEAWNGLGTIYWFDDFVKAKRYFQKAYDLTVNKFKTGWPKELLWVILENRQYLRAIQYLGLVYWREDQNEEAMEKFKLLLKLNPNDNQGARFMAAALYKKIKWEEYDDYDGNMEKEMELLEEMNKMYGFWRK